MKKALVTAGFIFVILMQFSCSGVKNVSGTLNKSGTSATQHDYKYDARTDYRNAGSDTWSKDSAEARSVSESNQRERGDSYRKDYSKNLTEERDLVSGRVTAGGGDANEKLVRQHEEMDRLADLVLYELNIVEKRWDFLIDKYKSASSAERTRISDDLDHLTADQLLLYRAHVKIYRDGKTDWFKTKNEVESTLLSVRGVGKK